MVDECNINGGVITPEPIRICCPGLVVVTFTCMIRPWANGPAKAFFAVLCFGPGANPIRSHFPETRRSMGKGLKFWGLVGPVEKVIGITTVPTGISSDGSPTANGMYCERETICADVGKGSIVTARRAAPALDTRRRLVRVPLVR